jgi:hypothetical protein
MQAAGWLLLAAVAWMPAGCSRSPKPAPKAVEAVRITQFYASPSIVARGEKGLVCYGVENAKAVWLAPPKTEQWAALTRCVEVAPAGNTTYTLTAEGADGKTVTRDVAVQVGRARPKIVNVQVSALQVKAGQLVNICYTVEGAQSVRIDPIGFRAGAKGKGCVNHLPTKTTTYVVSAVGADGDKDQERVTVKVQ